MKRYHPLLLSVLAGLLLYAAWPPSPLIPLIFVALIPLIQLSQQDLPAKQHFGYTYLAMVIWNAGTTWWVWNASPPGAVGAILANSALMCIPWFGYRKVHRRLGEKAGYASLIAFWLTFEYFHLHDWGLSWPWLTLGNIFATHTAWIQWYEFTGVSGGGLWILVVNVLVFILCKQIATRQKRTRTTIALSVAILLPILISVLNIPADLLASKPITGPGPQPNIVLVQPNIDPYEKLEEGTIQAQLNKLIHISDSAIDDQTTLVVWPETAVYMDNGIIESDMKANFFLNPLWDFLRRHPHINLLTGVESRKLYREGQQSSTAHKIEGTPIYVDSYNAACILDSSGLRQSYHKSMLVPGVETLPAFLHIIDSWFEKLGGTTAGYTGQSERTVLNTTDNKYHIAPSVCYESIYGEFMSRYVRNGADIIAIITNDGWWGNTPGYGQHENYARLRAIESRRWLIRSANTGVSCVIDPSGNITESRPWMQAAYIRTVVPTKTGLTFYAAHGDIISMIAVIAAIAALAWFYWSMFNARSKKRQANA